MPVSEPLGPAGCSVSLERRLSYADANEPSNPLVRGSPASATVSVADDSHAGEVPLASTQHQPASVQQFSVARGPLLRRDADVIDRCAAFLDGATRGPLALAQTRRDEQV